MWHSLASYTYLCRTEITTWLSSLHMKYSPSPSLSDYRKLRLPNTKSDLLKCLEQPGQSEPPSTYDCKLLDGAVIVHCLLISAVSTFHEYADRVFIPHIEKQLQEAVRMDVVRDTYIRDSLKASAREKRGKGVRRKVSGETKLLDKWMDFLCDQLTRRSFLPSKVEDFNWHPTKAVYVTSGQAVATVGASISMQNCNHEEADLRCGSCASWSSTRREDNKVRTVDTDVVLILVGKLHVWLLFNLWLTSGLLLEWATTIGFTTSTPSVQALETHSHEHYLLLTYSQVAT